MWTGLEEVSVQCWAAQRQHGVQGSSPLRPPRLRLSEAATAPLRRPERRVQRLPLLRPVQQQMLSLEGEFAAVLGLL